ncbi:MAG: ribonuclease HII [Promethearchaeota archaeon]
MMSRRIAGVDEAGRGPVIGPMVIAGVVIDENKLDALVEWGVRDSKQLTPRQRENLDQIIRKVALQIEVLEISPKEIDTQRLKNKSLNTLEAQWMAQILQRLRWDVAYVDAADVNAGRYGRFIQAQLSSKSPIVSEHGADATYPIVGAASIVAKVRRDQEIVKLHKSFGDFGSGYPNDPKTLRFLKEWLTGNDDFPEIVRHTWETASKILATHRQKILGNK